MTRIKVCGIMNSAELLQAALAGADAVGFIVEIDDSRHRLSAKDAADLIKLVPLFTKSVAVIAPDDLEGAVKLARQTGADVLQVHGSLSAEDLAELKGRVAQKLVATVAAGSDLNEIRSYAASADAVLLDTLANGKLGGTGAVHDWNKSAKIVEGLKVPVILAGGLNPGKCGCSYRKGQALCSRCIQRPGDGRQEGPAKDLFFCQGGESMPSSTVEPVYVDVTDKVSVDAPLSLYLALRGTQISLSAGVGGEVGPKGQVLLRRSRPLRRGYSEEPLPAHGILQRWHGTHRGEAVRVRGCGKEGLNSTRPHKERL